MSRKNVCGAVLVAAGSAQRMEGIDKIMTPLGGVPLLLRTARALSASSRIDSIIVVTREDLVEPVRSMCAAEKKVTAVIVGGASRAESVLRGLEMQTAPLVAIHDGARPLVTPELIDAAVTAAETFGAAAPAIPVHDTIKVAQNGLVTATPDRSTLFAVQTPQVFARTVIHTALVRGLAAGLPLTDDCSAVEQEGIPVHLTPGSRENLKITVPTDLLLAEAILKGRKTQ